MGKLNQKISVHVAQLKQYGYSFNYNYNYHNSNDYNYENQHIIDRYSDEYATNEIGLIARESFVDKVSVIPETIIRISMFLVLSVFDILFSLVFFPWHPCLWL